MDEYQKAYHILYNGVMSAINELNQQPTCKAGQILLDSIRDAESCICNKDERVDQTGNPALLVPIEELGLPVHEYHILQRAKLHNLAELIALGPAELRKQRNCGEKAYRIIMEKLEEAGFELTDEWL